MKVNQRNYRAFWAALPLVLFIILWLFFAPVQAGGKVVYVILNGNSMEPQFNFGDLVLLRQSSGYQIGDAVAYRNADLERYVFHRIIREENNRFILKGDNNAWEDDYAPGIDELLGKLWVYIPEMGKTVHWLRQPIVLAVISAILLLTISLGLLMNTNQKKQEGLEVFNWAKFLQTVFYTLGFLTFSFFALCIFAFSQPVSRGSIVSLPLYHFGTFSYSGNAPEGIYDSSTLHESDPVFPALTCQIDIGFGYSLVSEDLSDVNGSYQVDAVIKEKQSGWTRSLPLIPVTGFSGNMFVANSSVNICNIQQIVEKFKNETNFNSPSYVLSIIPHIQVSGLTKGKSFTDSFKPALEFKYDNVLFSVKKKDAESNPLAPNKTGTVLFPSIEPNHLKIIGIDFSVRALRQVGTLFFILSTVGFIVLALCLNGVCIRDPEMVVKLKYGSMLLDANESNIEPTLKTISVKSMDELARIAEHCGKFIYYKKQSMSILYYVNHEDITYRFIQRLNSQNIPELPKKDFFGFIRKVLNK